MLLFQNCGPITEVYFSMPNVDNISSVNYFGAGLIAIFQANQYIDIATKIPTYCIFEVLPSIVKDTKFLDRLT